MKGKLLVDIGIYVFIPILFYNIISQIYISFITLAIVAVGITYSYFVKKNECRINLCGIIFMTLYVITYLYRNDVSNVYELYVKDTYLMIFFSLVILIPTMIGKNIIYNIYSDCLKASGYNNLAIYNHIKINKLDSSFSKILAVIVVHLICLSFIRIYSISSYGIYEFTKTLDVETITCLAFIVLEIAYIYRIKSNINYSPKSSSKSKYKYNLNDSRVINFSSYKRTNKSV